MERKELGCYIVADPKICHGKPTFRGTRIMVKSVLEHVMRGEDWASISADTDGKVSVEAIAEAVQLAYRAFLDHLQEYSVEPYLASIDQREREPAAV
jgi:uncharacterized protein (DUF433 family)